MAENVEKLNSSQTLVRAYIQMTLIKRHIYKSGKLVVFSHRKVFGTGEGWMDVCMDGCNTYVSDCVNGGFVLYAST